MTDDAKLAEIRDIVRNLSDELAPTLRRASAVNGHLPVILALLRAAAHHAMHDGQSQEDFDTLCDAAWRTSAKSHKRRCDA